MATLSSHAKLLKCNFSMDLCGDEIRELNCETKSLLPLVNKRRRTNEYTEEKKKMKFRDNRKQN